MKIKYKFFICTLLLSIFCKAQLWQYDYVNGPPYRSTFAVSIHKNEVFNTNYAGEVFRSDNKGQSWIKCSMPPGSALVVKRSGNNILAGNFLSSDSGATWQTVSNVVGSFENFVVEGATIYGVTNAQPGKVYKSINSGSNWQDITYGHYAPGYTDIVKIDSSLFISGLNVGVSYKKVSDTIWSARNNGLPMAVLSLFGKNNHLYAATDGTGIFYSNDKGLTWVHENLTDNKYFNRLAGNDSIIYAATHSGIFKSKINSHIWIPLTGLPSYYPVTDIAVSGDTLYASTNTDGLFRSFDGGVTWKNVHAVSRGAMVSALEVTDNYIFASTPSYGRFFRSSDNGNYWDCTAGISFNCLFYHNNRLYGGEIDKRKIHFSDDDGLNWTSSESGFVDDKQAKKFLALDSTVFVVKDYLYKSIDNGINWIKIPVNNNDKVISIAKINNTIFAITNQGIFKTTNLGSSWINLSSNFSPGTSYKALSSGQTNLFLNCGAIYQSSDYGNTWQILPNTTGYFFTSYLNQIDDKAICTFYSLDSHGDEIYHGLYMYEGNTWQLLNMVAPDYNGTIIKYNGIIWAGVWPGVTKVLTPVAGINHLMPSKIAVAIYPNPSNGHITVVSGENDFIMEVKIINSLGQSLYLKKYSKYTYHENINISSQPKGVYIIQVQTKGGTQTHKIMIE